MSRHGTISHPTLNVTLAPFFTLGPENFSPVLSASWLGALHGAAAICPTWIDESRMLQQSTTYHRCDVRNRIRSTARELAALW